MEADLKLQTIEMDFYNYSIIISDKYVVNNFGCLCEDIDSFF